MPLLHLGGRPADESGVVRQWMAVYLGGCDRQVGQRRASTACITAASSAARSAFAVSTVVEGATSSSLTASAAASLSAPGIRIEVFTVSGSALSSSSLIRSMTWSSTTLRLYHSHVVQRLGHGWPWTTTW